MRPFSVLLLFLLWAGSGFSQGLDYENAPRAFLGYPFGASLGSVTDRLTQAGTPFQSALATGKDGLQRVTVPRQTLDKLENVTVELAFSQDRLFQISASTAYSPEVLKSLVDVLASKYGPVKSLDGGYSYLWFFRSKAPSTSAAPAFALALKNDPVTKKTIVLSYVDNLVKASAAAAGAAPQQLPVPETPAAPPALDSSRF